MSRTKATAKPTGTILQRLVLPADADFDTLPLYAEGGVALPSAEAAPGPRGGDAATKPTTVEPVHPDLVVGRRSIRVPAGIRISFATYFNAFPSSYWRRWTSVEHVKLSVTITGTADVLVYRSSARGDQHRMGKTTVTDGAADFELPLDMFGDGGWYWFDVVGVSDAVVESANWVSDESPEEPGKISIGITTFNRPSDCVLLLKSIASDAEALALVDSVFVIDQGNQKVEDDPGFAGIAKELGERLKVVHQANLGGSGGFSRAMYETTYGELSRYVLLLDDDALVEPEGILRAVTFADLCRTPTIVGGHMLNMHVKSTLHAFGERVNKYRFWWGADPHTKNAHNFAELPLRSTRWLHRRVDVDYNGWWMCLIPTEVVREIGLSLPIFIKWDDAEYALRAKEFGVPTVSLPGAAVWHVNWADKDDAVDWQAYHHARNRILVALLHSPYPRGGRLLMESMASQLKHAMSMQYSTAELRIWALEDILAGPDHLHRTLPTRLGEIRAYRSGQDDAVVAKDPLAYPSVKRVKPPKRGKDPTEPKGLLGRYTGAAAGLYRQMQPVRDTSRNNPEARVPAMDSRWRLLSQFDSAVVSTADGSGAAWYKRDRKRFTDIMRRSAFLHERLMMNWDELAQQYKDAAPELTDPKSWMPTWGPGDE